MANATVSRRKSLREDKREQDVSVPRDRWRGNVHGYVGTNRWPTRRGNRVNPQYPLRTWSCRGPPDIRTPHHQKECHRLFHGRRLSLLVCNPPRWQNASRTQALHHTPGSLRHCRSTRHDPKRIGTCTRQNLRHRPLRRLHSALHGPSRRHHP